MQDVWMACKAEEIQGYADRNEWKYSFSTIRATYGLTTKANAPILSADGGTLLTVRISILQSWAEHFRGVLNHPIIIFDTAIAHLPPVETNADLHLPPSLHKTMRAVQLFSSGKASGSDVIPVEIYTHADPQLMDHLTALFQEVWLQGEVSGKVIASSATTIKAFHVEHHRGNLRSHSFQPSEQPSRTGSPAGKPVQLPSSSWDYRKLQKKCQEMRTHLHSTFVDLKKAFDTVNREGLRKIMQKFGCPERFSQMVRQLHDGMMARVTNNGVVSEAFAVANGVKQECVLAPTLFSFTFSAMLLDAYHNDRAGIRVAYRTDGQLFTQWRMQFQ
nr:unnamed protein product [Spirometra erinaceieuropaei]